MYRPRSLLLQWHLTDRCNLRCAHCYQDSYRHETRGLADWFGLLDDYCAFLYAAHETAPLKGHINVTGGEPFALHDLPALLEKLAAHRQAFGVGILSNGTLIDRDIARYLKRWQVSFVQISIDGTPATHDIIRGQGSHAQAVAGIQALVAAGLRVLVSFTAGRDNYREFSEVVRLGHELGVSRVWSDREIPSCAEVGSRLLTQAETVEYLELIALAKARMPTKSHTEVALHRALQFLQGGDSVYHCTAGDSLITVMPDGTVYPCRRLPIPIGNAYEQGLAAVYDAARMREVRTVKTFQGCEHCSFVGQCKGGLRCLTWAVYGRLDVADPGCALAQAGPDGPRRIHINLAGTPDVQATASTTTAAPSTPTAAATSPAASTP